MSAREDFAAGMGLSLLVVLLATPVVAQAPPVVPFTPGMVITHSVRIKPGVYEAPGSDVAAITIRGSDVSVDLRGVELVGSDDRTHPDQFVGTAVRIDGGRNITVRGVRARGYKSGIVAWRVTRLSLLYNDLSFNYRPRLYSGVTKESLIDWLDYHQNDHDEWLRYGAGIYLADVTLGEVLGNRVTDGMNGLMLARSTGVRVWNNTFEFNSGVGIGMYRASRNVLMHNRVDWNVRGYSHGFYNRGQDSAGLLMYEQSSNNTVAYNSVTHSGDGLFLWAGQSTMDTGKGGANDNLFYGNDFSYAPTNAMEATFSRNRFIGNRATDSWHGLWGGYSYGSLILGNDFARNVEAISIEHGQQNTIAGNTFDHDTVAIHTWGGAVEPSDWGYPRSCDTRSHDLGIFHNFFRGNHVALRLDNTQDAHATGNQFIGVDTISRVTGDSSGWIVAKAGAALTPAQTAIRYRVPPLQGGTWVVGMNATRNGRQNIIVGPWGPHDWHSGLLWPAGRDDGASVTLRLIDVNSSRWQVVERVGVLSYTTGREGGDAVVHLVADPARTGPIRFTIEYRETRPITTEFGEVVPAGQPIRLAWSGDPPPIAWHLRFVRWDSVAAPLADSGALRRAFADSAAATMDTTRLDLSWYGPPKKAIPATSVLTEATGTITLGDGEYQLRTIADDAVRVYVDNRLVLDDWRPGESHLATARFSGAGTHQLRVEHLQRDGWYELRLDLDPIP